jgi:hypothetical protein
MEALRLIVAGTAVSEAGVSPDDAPESGLTRGQILAALEARGLKASGREEDSLWVVRFEGSDAFLQCQEKDGLTRFATLDQSSFDESQVPPQAFEALMELGWECDESVG